MPPLSDAAWQAAFDLYRQSPQYALLNEGMSLGDFKTIYWWEWAHRELGRFIGLVYIAGFLWFVGRRSVSGRTRLVARRRWASCSGRRGSSAGSWSRRG